MSYRHNVSLILLALVSGLSLVRCLKSERLQSQENAPTSMEKIARSLPSRYNLSEECGIEGPSLQNRNENGDVQWPWIVGIFIDDMYFCTGTLVSESWVLTPAHCVYGGYDFSVQAGIGSDDEVFISSATGIVHEDFDASDLTNDIALIHLPHPVTFSHNIRPSCLPMNGHESEEGDLVSVIGIVETVHDLQVVNHQECAGFGNFAVDMICVEPRRPSDSLTRAPLMERGQLKDIGQKWTQVGVEFLGSSSGAILPELFTSTLHHLDWILDKTSMFNH